MKRVILLLILTTSCLWAKTWTQFLGGNEYGTKENDSVTIVSSESIMTTEKYLLFDSTLMTITENPKPFNYLYIGEEIKAIDYFGNNSSNTQSCLVLEPSPNCFFNMKYYSKIDDNSSIWIQKNNGFLFSDSLVLQDTNFFIVPSIEKDTFFDETDMGFLLENYSISEGRLDSVYFIYKKDSSYYAYCLYTQSKKCLTFLFQCTFQDDGSTQFEPFETIEYPYPYYGPHKVDYSSSECMTKSQYEEYMPIPVLSNVKKENKQSTPYLVNGTPSESNHSKITIQNKQPKLQLKK